MEKTSYSIGELVACARREVAYRKRVYARLVSADTMSQEQADHEIRLMQAIAELLDGQQQLSLF